MRIVVVGFSPDDTHVRFMAATFLFIFSPEKNTGSPILKADKHLPQLPLALPALARLKDVQSRIHTFSVPEPRVL